MHNTRLYENLYIIFICRDRKYISLRFNHTHIQNLIPKSLLHITDEVIEVSAYLSDIFIYIQKHLKDVRYMASKILIIK